MSADSLLPCPFCGGPADIVPDRLEPKTEDHVYVMCKACDIYAPGFIGRDEETRAGQIAAWNRRAPQQAPGDAALVEALSAVVDSILVIASTEYGPLSAQEALKDIARITRGAHRE